MSYYTLLPFTIINNHVKIISCICHESRDVFTAPGKASKSTKVLPNSSTKEQRIDVIMTASSTDLTLVDCGVYEASMTSPTSTPSAPGRFLCYLIYHFKNCKISKAYRLCVKLCVGRNTAKTKFTHFIQWCLLQRYKFKNGIWWTLLKTDVYCLGNSVFPYFSLTGFALKQFKPYCHLFGTIPKTIWWTWVIRSFQGLRDEQNQNCAFSSRIWKNICSPVTSRQSQKKLHWKNHMHSNKFTLTW